MKFHPIFFCIVVAISKAFLTGLTANIKTNRNQHDKKINTKVFRFLLLSLAISKQIQFYHTYITNNLASQQEFSGIDSWLFRSWNLPIRQNIHPCFSN